MYISEVIQTIAVTYCYMLLLAFYNHHHVTSIGMSWAIGRALATFCWKFWLAKLMIHIQTNIPGPWQNVESYNVAQCANLGQPLDLSALLRNPFPFGSAFDSCIPSLWLNFCCKNYAKTPVMASCVASNWPQVGQHVFFWGGKNKDKATRLEVGFQVFNSLQRIPVKLCHVDVLILVISPAQHAGHCSKGSGAKKKTTLDKALQDCSM